MITEIKATPEDTFESIVYTLLAAKARGEHAYCIYNGHKLQSDTITADILQDAYLFEKDDSKEREKRYAKKVEQSRKLGVTPITYDVVIKGLKFIAEHQSMTHDELVDGLLELGCNFSLKEIAELEGSNERVFDGLRRGSLFAGASVIVNTRDSEFSRDLCDDKFLSVDNDTSIYHYIRINTGDDSYTKEMVDSISGQKHR